MFPMNKMDAKALREVAKQREVHGYSKMTKTKLIAAVREAEKQRKMSDFDKPQALLDSPVPDLQEPILQPTKSKPKSFAEIIKHMFSEYKSDFTCRVEVSLSRVKYEINSLADSESSLRLIL